LPVSFYGAFYGFRRALLHLDLGKRVLEDVHDCDPVGGDILTFADLFSGADCEVPFDVFRRGERGDRTVLTHPLSFGADCVCGGRRIPAFLMTKIIGKHLESLYIIGSALLIGGIVMWFVDARNAKAEAGGRRRGERAALFRRGIWRI